MLIKPYTCTAIGCIHRAPKDKPFCDAHWERLIGFAKGPINKATPGADFSKGQFSREYLAAVYRAQTLLGIKDRRIPKDLRDRREYYVRTQIEGMTREEAIA